MTSGADLSDDELFHDDVDPGTAPGGKRLLPHPVSLLLFGILLALIGAGLAAWLPVTQARRDIADLEERGAQVGKQRGGHPWLEWLDLGDSDMFPRVIVVDMSHTPTTDADLGVISGFKDLRSLAIFGPGVTDEGLEQLERLARLEALVLIDCPEVTTTAIAKLQSERPKLVIVRRGPAFLGIAGERAQRGCRVVEVVPRSAAHTAGLKGGDIITAFGGQPTPDFEALVELIGKIEPGEAVKIDVLRGEDELQLEAVLGRWQ